MSGPAVPLKRSGRSVPTIVRPGTGGQSAGLANAHTLTSFDGISDRRRTGPVAFSVANPDPTGTFAMPAVVVTGEVPPLTTVPSGAAATLPSNVTAVTLDLDRPRCVLHRRFSTSSSPVFAPVPKLAKTQRTSSTALQRNQVGTHGRRDVVDAEEPAGERRVGLVEPGDAADPPAERVLCDQRRAQRLVGVGRRWRPARARRAPASGMSPWPRAQLPAPRVSPRWPAIGLRGRSRCRDPVSPPAPRRAAGTTASQMRRMSDVAVMPRARAPRPPGIDVFMSHPFPRGSCWLAGGQVSWLPGSLPRLPGSAEWLSQWHLATATQPGHSGGTAPVSAPDFP